MEKLKKLDKAIEMVIERENKRIENQPWHNEWLEGKIQGMKDVQWMIQIALLEKQNSNK